MQRKILYILYSDGDPVYGSMDKSHSIDLLIRFLRILNFKSAEELNKIL